MGDERVFLNEGDVYVSNFRIVLRGTTYATANITSVSKLRTNPSPGCSIVMIIFGVIGVLMSLVFFGIDVGLGIVALIANAGLLALGIFWFKSLKPAYFVNLSSASGERRELTSKDEAMIDRVVNAISEAITSRG